MATSLMMTLSPGMREGGEMERKRESTADSLHGHSALFLLYTSMLFSFDSKFIAFTVI